MTNHKKEQSVRKIIALSCMLVLAFVTIFCLAAGKEIPQSVDSLLTAFIGFIGYYFGKSTALDGAEVRKEEHTKR